MALELAIALGGTGWRVSVVTGFPNHPYGKLYDGYRMVPHQREDVQGVRVHRTWHLLHPSRRTWVRALQYATQVAGGAAVVAAQRKVDVVLAIGPPLLGPLAAALVARATGARLVTVLYDLYPDIAVELGVIRHQLFIRLAREAERLQHRASDAIVVLSEGFRETLLSRGVPAEKIRVIPVWIDGKEVHDVGRENKWRAENGIATDQFVVLYAGTMGAISGGEVLLDVAEDLAADSEVLLLIVGEGQKKSEVEREARSRGLGNIRCLPLQPRERLAEVQSTADVGLVTLAPGRGRTSVPSKVLGYFAAGRPVIAAVDEQSDTARQISAAKAGLVTPPGDVSALVGAIKWMRDHAEERRQMGLSARAELDRVFTKERVVTRFQEVLSEVAS